MKTQANQSNGRLSSFSIVAISALAMSFILLEDLAGIMRSLLRTGVEVLWLGSHNFQDCLFLCGEEVMSHENVTCLYY